MKKKILSILLATAILSATACQSKQSTGKSEITRITTQPATTASTQMTSEIADTKVSDTTPTETQIVQQSPSLTVQKLTNSTQREKNQYDMNVKLDTEKHQLNITQKLKYINSTDSDLKDIYFNCIPAAYKEKGGGVNFESIKANGQELHMENVKETVYKLPLGKELKKGESIDLEMEYTVSIPDIPNRFGHVGHAYNLGNFIATPALHENGEWLVQPYVEIGDAFYTEVADYHVKLEVPDGYKVCASGTLKDGIYEANDMRDFAFSTAEDLLELTEKVDDCDIHVFYKETCKYQAETVMRAAKDSLALFNKTCGGYPYETLNLMLCSVADDIGGMEYPGMILLQAHENQDKKYEYANGHISYEEYKNYVNELLKSGADTCLSLAQDEAGNLALEDEQRKFIIGETNALAICTAHEIAHQWFYGIVGNDEIRHAWIDEGMARFLENFYFDKCIHDEPLGGQGLESLKMSNEYFHKKYNGTSDGDMNPDLNSSIYDFKSQPMDYWDIYDKGAALMYGLYSKLGEEKFISALQEYVATFAFSEVDPQEFQDFWNKQGDFSELFKVYLSTPVK